MVHKHSNLLIYSHTIELGAIIRANVALRRPTVTTLVRSTHAQTQSQLFRDIVPLRIPSPRIHSRLHANTDRRTARCKGSGMDPGPRVWVEPCNPSCTTLIGTWRHRQDHTVWFCRTRLCAATTRAYKAL